MLIVDFNLTLIGLSTSIGNQKDDNGDSLTVERQNISHDAGRNFWRFLLDYHILISSSMFERIWVPLFTPIDRIFFGNGLPFHVKSILYAKNVEEPHYDMNIEPEDKS